MSPLPPEPPQPAPARPGNAGRADYPRMLYNADGRTIIVQTPEEHDRLQKEGWDTQPMEIHRHPRPSTTPVASGGEPLAQMIREVMEAVLDERGITKKGVHNGTGKRTSE